MKRDMILWLLFPLCCALYQLFIKLATATLPADFGVAWLWQAIVTPWIWAALLSEIASFILWMCILSSHAISKAFPLSAISYLLILCIGWFGFNETILPLQLAGILLILAGVWLIATVKPSKEILS